MKKETNKYILLVGGVVSAICFSIHLDFLFYGDTSVSCVIITGFMFLAMVFCFAGYATYKIGRRMK